MALLREFLQVTKESAYKTPMASPVRGTDQLVIRLDQANGFTMRPKPMTTKVPFGGGRAVNAFTVSDQVELKGGLNLVLCYSQAEFLLGWLAQEIVEVAGAGVDTPWETSEPAGDLASCTIDHAIFRDETGNYKRTRYSGIKCASGKLECSRESRIARLTLELQGSTYSGHSFGGAAADPDDTAFPVPDDDEFPSDTVLFLHSAGLLTIAEARTQFSSLMLNIANKMDARWYENRFVNTLRNLGRDTTLEVGFKLKDTPNDRASYEDQTPLTASVGFSGGSGSKLITLDLLANTVIESLEDDLAADKVYDRKLTLMSYWDNAEGTDLAVAVEDVA